jgi:transcriptional repressor NrdR
VQLREVVVVKSGDRREPFDRSKLEHSIALASRKRGIDQERLDQLISGIQRQVETSGEAEVPSSHIGELVMEGLRQIDSVAYIRFASVYRDFSEARDFEEFASTVQQAAKE